MEIKLFEVRDRATLMPVMGIRLQVEPQNLAAPESLLLMRAGYGADDLLTGSLVVLVMISGGRGPSTCDPYDWSCDTRRPAHEHITKNWADLQSGQVIDSEFLRGEREAPRASEFTPEGASQS